MWKERPWCSSVGNVLSPVSIKRKPKKKGGSKKKQEKEKRSSASDPPNGPNPVEVSCPVLAPVEDEEFVEEEDNWTEHTFPVPDAAAAAEAAVQARVALHSLKGPARLKSHVGGSSVRHQTSNALKDMQIRSRLQFQVRSRRVRISQENRALQRRLFHAKELEKLKVRGKWDGSLLSKEQIEAKLFHKYGAAMRREKSLAYSYAHQQTRIKSTQNNPLLGWIWLDRWMTAIQPWEALTTAGKEHSRNCSASLRMPAGDITKCLACHLLNPEYPSSLSIQNPHSHHSPLTACSNTGSSSSTRKLISAGHSRCIASPDNDSRYALTRLSEQYQRHTIAGPLARRDERLTSSPSVPNYMAPTHSAIAKLKLPNPSGKESCIMPEKGLMGSTKRLSYPANGRCVGSSLADARSVVEENDVKGMLR